MEQVVLFAVLVLLVLLAGGIAGLVALSSVRGLRNRMDDLQARAGRIEAELRTLKQRPDGPPVPQQPAATPTAAAVPPPLEVRPAVCPTAATHSSVLPPRPPVPPTQPPGLPPTALPPVWEKPRPAPPSEARQFEHVLGTQWLLRLGIVFLVIGGGFFLKYAYDNSMIGPLGRVAIWFLGSLAALIAGERFRRRGWVPLFHALTGGGLAGLYTCVFFSFRLYGLAGQGLAMSLAVGITALAVALAVVHNALPIAILGLLGGYLSPVLLSTGVNHPHAFFLYVLILDGVALGTAWFRRWRALDLFAFVATVFLYLGWYEKFYDHWLPAPTQMLPALLYAAAFYLVFLLTPTLHSLRRRAAQPPEAIVLLALNGAWSLVCFYRILFDHHRSVLGLVVVAQALLVVALFQACIRRTRTDRRGAESLLVLALALVTLAIPIQLRLYAVPLAWALEAVVLAHLVRRFQRTPLLWGASAAFLLAVWGLLGRLPLHSLVFTPVFNAPFGSWLAVAFAGAAIAWMFTRPGQEPRRPFAVAAGVIAAALLCLALSLETVQFWDVDWRQFHPAEPQHRVPSHVVSSLVVLWSAISLAMAAFLARPCCRPRLPFLLVPCAIGTVLFVLGTANAEFYRSESTWYLANRLFPFRLVFVLTLWALAAWMRRLGRRETATPLAAAGHVLLWLLLTMETLRLAQAAVWMPRHLAIGLLSALWGLHAFSLVTLGLVRRDRPLRILGFLLFALTIGKVLLVDTSELEKVYRIFSFLGAGAFLMLAGYSYQRFSLLVLQQPDKEKPQ